MPRHIEGDLLLALSTHASSVLAQRFDPARPEFGEDPARSVPQVQVAGGTASGNWAKTFAEVGGPEVLESGLS